MAQEVGTRMERAESEMVNLDWEEELRKFQTVIASGTKFLKMKAMVKLARSAKHAPDHVLSCIITILIEIHGQDDSNDSAPSLQEVAAYCLKCIVCQGDNAMAIKLDTEGNVHSLIRLLAHSEGKKQEELIELLLFLVTFFKSTRGVVVNYGGFRVIMNLLDYPNNDTRHYLLEILSVLALHKDVRKEVIKLGALHLIVEAAGTGNMLSRERACQSIGFFGFSREARRELVELGVIPVLAEMWRDGDQTTKHIAAAYVMWYLSCYQSATSVIRDSGAIPILVEHFGSGTEEVMEKVIGAFLQLSFDKFDRMRLAKAGAIPILMDLLHHKNEEVRDNAAKAVINFYEDPLHYNRVSHAINAPSFRNMHKNRILSGLIMS